MRRAWRGLLLPRAAPALLTAFAILTGILAGLPSIDYKSSTIKQYFKEQRALRTETTINDTRDFRIGRKIENLTALRELAFSANRRLLDVQKLDHDPTLGYIQKITCCVKLDSIATDS